MDATIVIQRRFRGPPESGNGGYVSGRLAAYVDGIAEVTLRAPPPLDAELEVEKGADGAVLLSCGGEPIAEAAPAECEIDAPPPPDFGQATAASESYLGFRAHAFPGCFVCGPERSAPDGLRVFPGPIPGSSMVAAPWIPTQELADRENRIRAEFVWAVLDCPGYFALPCAGETAMLGRMAARIVGSVHVGERSVVIGWPISQDGRKHVVGTALFGNGGRLAGIARATWIRTRTSLP